MAKGKEMAKFRWLEIYLDNEEKIANLELDIRRTEIELERWTSGDLSHVKITKKSHGARVEEVLDENRQLLQEDKVIRAKTLALIDKFDGIENQILRKKYIEGMSLSDIADCPDVHYSYSTIKKLHAELKRRLRFLDKWDVPDPREDRTPSGSKKVHP